VAVPSLLQLTVMLIEGAPQAHASNVGFIPWPAWTVVVKEPDCAQVGVEDVAAGPPPVLHAMHPNKQATTPAGCLMTRTTSHCPMLGALLPNVKETPDVHHAGRAFFSG
jgi:hypothetical protein